MFQKKPNFDNNSMETQDQNLINIQDPTHYLLETKFMAPGPIGQCYSLPNDLRLIKELKKIAINYDYIYKQYNIKI